MDRKHYSRRREANLYSIVDKAIIDLRIDALRGCLNYASKTDQEAAIIKRLEKLPGLVCAEYRKSLSSKPNGSGN